jgi:AcrR family transcriptional regulator
MSDDVFAADGRVIGSRALATRRKLLDATAKLLQEQGILDLRVVDISRHIGSSPATFYQYFNDVDEAILELSKEATEDEKPLVALLQPGWTGSDGLERAGKFVDAYMLYWDTRPQLKSRRRQPSFPCRADRSELARHGCATSNGL